MNSEKKKVICMFLFLAACVLCRADEQWNVCFYGVIPPVSQDNQKTITEDLFCAQIRIISNVMLSDRRSSGISGQFSGTSEDAAGNFSPELFFDSIPETELPESDENAVLLFSKIDKIDEDIWKCSFFAKNPATQKIDTLENTFESYYKLLTDAKNSIVKIISQSAQTPLTVMQIKKNETQKTPAKATMTVEGVSGTWTGETGITKIILMRSGRGFVIFNNGASMSISISVDTTETGRDVLKITQNGNFNASFYPEIPRQQALAAARTSKPIEWTFVLSENGTLNGYKASLGIDKNGNVTETVQNVQWSKIN